MLTRTLPVRDIRFATSRIRLITLDVEETPFHFTAGQAVLVGLHGSPLRKPYSIASSPTEAAESRHIELLVQLDNNDALDPHLERAAAGTLVDVDGPIGTFGAVPPAGASPIMFVAGGTGIAPLRSMLMERLAAAPPMTISVVYSARSMDELAYRLELEALAAAGRIQVRFTLTRDSSGAWAGRQGRIDEALLREALPSPDAQCFLCGPPSMVLDAAGHLRALGVPQERIFTEAP